MSENKERRDFKKEQDTERPVLPFSGKESRSGISGPKKKGVFPGTGRKEKEMNSARRKKLCVDEAIIPAENFNHNIEKLPKFWRSFTKKGRKKAGSRRNPLSF